METMKLLLKGKIAIANYFFYSVIVTVVDTGIVWALVRFSSVHLVTANTIGVVTGFLLHYLLASKSVFDTEYGIAGFVIYLATFLVGLVLANWLIFMSYNYVFHAFFSRSQDFDEQRRFSCSPVLCDVLYKKIFIFTSQQKGMKSLQHSQYRFKFYFNASHAIYLSGEMGQSHPHTWEVILNVMKVTDNFVLFDEVEKMCEEFLSRFQDVFINTVEPFTTINPTLENLCNYFKEKLQESLHDMGWLLLSIELSETPSRSYVISVIEEMEVRKSYFESESEETLQEIIDKMTKEKMDSMKKPPSAKQTEEQEKELREIEKRVSKPKDRLFRSLTGKKLFK
jgi:6-pyruvoyltetrahydropterin/6-carboxytetrahydropterin synthase